MCPFSLSFFHSISVSSSFFPPLILRWLDLICMHLHNESHLHAQGQTVPWEQTWKGVCTCVCVCARSPRICTPLCSRTHSGQIAQNVCPLIFLFLCVFFFALQATVPMPRHWREAGKRRVNNTEEGLLLILSLLAPLHRHPPPLPPSSAHCPFFPVQQDATILEQRWHEMEALDDQCTGKHSGCMGSVLDQWHEDAAGLLCWLQASLWASKSHGVVLAYWTFHSLWIFTCASWCKGTWTLKCYGHFFKKMKTNVINVVFLNLMFNFLCIILLG